jgi:hypothetical protein
MGSNGSRRNQNRMRFTTQLIRLLLTMIPQQCGRALKDEDGMYAVGLAVLLKDIPLP